MGILHDKDQKESNNGFLKMGPSAGKSMPPPAFQLKAFSLDPSERHVVDAGAVPDHHVGLNIAATKFSYMTEREIKGDPKALEILSNMGYNGLGTIGFLGNMGYHALLVPPAHPEKHTLIIFSGTDPTDIEDVLTDLSMGSVGNAQYEDKINHQLIQEMFRLASQLSKSGKSLVIGHSLGGSLAQIAASEFGSQIAELVTFNSPGVGTGRLRDFKKQNSEDMPEVTHHINYGDMADMLGEGHIPGTIFEHFTERYHPEKAHNDFVLHTSEFEEQRRALGLETQDGQDEYLNTDIPESERRTKIKRHDNGFPLGRVPGRLTLETLRAFVAIYTAPFRRNERRKKN